MQRRAEPGTAHLLAAALGRRDDDLDHIDGNREANADRSARFRENRRIDADHAPVHIDQRSARIARINGGVGLNEEAVVGNADLRARQRRDDSLSHGLPDAEGIADGENEIADFERIRIAEFHHRKIAALGQFQHGEIGARIAQQDFRGNLPLVGQRNLNVGHALDDMMIGHDEAGGVDDDSRPQRLRDIAPGLSAALAKEAAEDRIVEKRIGGRAVDARGEDVDDGGLRLLHHRRERENGVGARLRYDPFLRSGRRLREGHFCRGARQDYRADQADRRGDDHKTREGSHPSSMARASDRSGRGAALASRRRGVWPAGARARRRRRDYLLAGAALGLVSTRSAMRADLPRRSRR